MTETTGGTKFQLPIYLLAAEAVLADEVGEVTDLSATYYQTRPPNRIREPWGIESKFDTDEAFRRFLDDVVPARLGALTTAIAAGRFHTTVLPASEAGCEHCDYRRACDVRHHQRRDRVELLDDDPETYVPVRATPREFDPTFGGDADD
jgi:ATP-dependent helicase/nuclease subunit B